MGIMIILLVIPLVMVLSGLVYSILIILMSCEKRSSKKNTFPIVDYSKNSILPTVEPPYQEFVGGGGTEIYPLKDNVNLASDLSNRQDKPIPEVVVPKLLSKRPTTMMKKKKKKKNDDSAEISSRPRRSRSTGGGDDGNGKKRENPEEIFIDIAT